MKLACRKALLLCATLALFPATSLAKPDSKAEALRHYGRGLELMQTQSYGEAIAEFNQAYDLGHDFAVLYDIGLAYTAMGENVPAIKTFRRYLDEGGKHIPAARRKDTEAEITRQEGSVATLIVHAKLDDVGIWLDGIEVGKTPLPEPIWSNAGPHLLSASAPGYRLWERRLDLASGDRRNFEIDLEADDAAAGGAGPAGASVAGTTTAAATPPAPAAFPTRKVLTYALGGAGVFALAVGGVYGLRALSKRQDSDAYCPQNQCSQTGVDLNNQAKTAARVADVSIAIGLVSVGVATYLLLRPPASATQPAATAEPTRVLATVGPQQAGLLVRGSW
jgi:tetratricopeptide (TPR) repeat protein